MADNDFVVKNGLIVNTNLLVANGDTNKVGINTSTPDAVLTVAGTANVSGNVSLTGSSVNVAANTTITGRMQVKNTAYIDTRLYVGNTSTMVTLTNPIIQAIDNFNGFVEISSQNLSKEDDSCADVLLYADNTDGGTYYNDIGINNSRFDGTIHRISANTNADSFIIGETVYQANSLGNVAVGVLKDITTINATSRSLRISVANGASFTNTAGANLAIRGVTSAVNASIIVAVPYGTTSSYSRRNLPFTIGKRTDGYLLVANAALTIGTTGGGIRNTPVTLSSPSFSSGANAITVSDTSALYADMIITGTGIPSNTFITSVQSNTVIKISKNTTSGSSGTYTAIDPFYNPTGNPIVFHVGGILAENEVASITGNGNFVIGPDTYTARNSKLNVAGTANIAGNTAFGNDVRIAGNASVVGSLSGSSPSAGLQINGNANVSGNLAVGGNFVVSGTLITTGASTANGDYLPISNGYNLGNSTARWNLYAIDAYISNTVNSVNASVSNNISVGANVTSNTSAVRVGNNTVYSYTDATKFETTGNVVASLVNAPTVNGSIATILTSVTIGGSGNSTVSNTTAIKLGNSSVNATINSTAYTGLSYTANNATNLGGVAASGYQTTAGLSANVATLTANNTAFVGTVTAANVVSNAQLQANLANYQTLAGLSSNVATLTANNTTFVGTVTAANVVSNAQLSANLANYQTLDGLSSNVALLTANNTAFVGTVTAANVVSNAQLQSNLANYQTLAGLSSNVALLTANNTTYFNGQAAAFYTNAANINTGTLVVARGGTGVTTSTGSNNVVLSHAPAFTGNASFNTTTLFIDSTNSRVGIGTATPTVALSVTGAITATGDITASSDERLKSNIRTIDNALSKVLQMRGVYYDKDGQASLGVIAQEIEKVLPEVVADGEYKSVAYGNIVGVLIEAIKELQAEIDELKSRGN